MYETPRETHVRIQDRVQNFAIGLGDRLYFKINQRSTPLNASAFGVTLDSSVKSRPGQQTKSTSPGRLQFGVIICYNKIKR